MNNLGSSNVGDELYYGIYDDVKGYLNNNI